MNRAHWLKKWRQRTGLSCKDVDIWLNFKPGTTFKLEKISLIRVPGHLIFKLIELYRIPKIEVVGILLEESREVLSKNI